jgi:hypothetical protein
MGRTKQWALYTLWGAMSYWIPDILVRLIWVPLASFFPPVICYAFCYCLPRRGKHQKSKIGITLCALLGVWLWGPTAMLIGGPLSGGTLFSSCRDLLQFLYIWLAFPLSTWVMSTYSGSLGGVALITIALIVRAIALKAGWIRDNVKSD